MNNKININNYLSYSIYIWYFVLILIGLIIGSTAGDDHGDYIVNWERSLSGNNPWQSIGPLGQINVYGPLHPLMSFFFYLHPGLPKLIYMLIFVSSNIYLFRTLKNINYFNNYNNILFFFLAIPFNFVIVNYVFIFGHNDSLVAGLLIFSLILRFNNKIGLSSILLTLSILEKYYTAVLLPIVLLDYIYKNNLKDFYKYLIYSIITTIIVLLLIFLLYGFNLDFLSNFLSQKNPHFFSYLASIEWFINFYVNRLGDLNYFYEYILKYSILLMIITYLAFLYFSFRYKLKFFFVSSVSLWIVLTLFSGSFMTYYISLFVLFSMMPLEENSNLFIKLQNSALPYFIFLSITSFMYLFVSDSFGEILGHMRNVLGFINLFLSFFSIFMLIGIYILSDNQK